MGLCNLERHRPFVKFASLRLADCVVNHLPRLQQSSGKTGPRLEHHSKGLTFDLQLFSLARLLRPSPSWLPLP